MSHAFPLPPDLPRPVDDGACRHLLGARMPNVVLPSTSGRMVDLGTLTAGQTVIYCYPMTGTPGKSLPDGWDSIPGARGCTPQTCGFRDHFKELALLGAGVFGLSAQTTAYQREMVERLHVPFEVLSDAEFKLCEALRLPTFEIAGMHLIKRVTLIVRNGVIATVLYPVFPPDQNAVEVLRWLAENPVG